MRADMFLRCKRKKRSTPVQSNHIHVLYRRQFCFWLLKSMRALEFQCPLKFRRQTLVPVSASPTPVFCAPIARLNKKLFAPISRKVRSIFSRMPETRKRKWRILFKQGKIEYKRVATNYRKVSKRCLIRENTLDEPETAQTARFYANLKLSKKWH